MFLCTALQPHSNVVGDPIFFLHFFSVGWVCVSVGGSLLCLRHCAVHCSFLLFRPLSWHNDITSCVLFQESVGCFKHQVTTYTNSCPYTMVCFLLTVMNPSCNVTDRPFLTALCYPQHRQHIVCKPSAFLLGWHFHQFHQHFYPAGGTNAGGLEMGEQVCVFEWAGGSQWAMSEKAGGHKIAQLPLKQINNASQDLCILRPHLSTAHSYPQFSFAPICL